MPRACTRKGRMIQVTKWLRTNFATAYPVKVPPFPLFPFSPSSSLSFLSSPSLPLFSPSFFLPPHFLFPIHINDSALQTMAEMTETLIHEWAHAVSEKFSRLEERRVSAHDDEFFLTWGRIYRAWMEQGGAEDACKYKF